MTDRWQLTFRGSLVATAPNIAALIARAADMDLADAGTLASFDGSCPRLHREARVGFNPARRTA